jgi:hypothetical protein
MRDNSAKKENYFKLTHYPKKLHDIQFHGEKPSSDGTATMPLYAFATWTIYATSTIERWKKGFYKKVKATNGQRALNASTMTIAPKRR